MEKYAFDIGEDVTVVGPGSMEYTDGVYWNPSMNCLIGRSGKVKRCVFSSYHDKDIPGYVIDFPDRKQYDANWSRSWIFTEKWVIGTVEDFATEDIETLW